MDYVIEIGEQLIPLEIKWTERPSVRDARHVRTFLREHPKRAPRGWQLFADR